MTAKEFYNKRAFKHQLKRAVKHDKQYFEDTIIELMEMYAQEQVKNLTIPVVSTRFSEAVEDIDSNGLECGLEDVGITDRYEAMQYGFDQCKERALEAIELASD